MISASGVCNLALVPLRAASSDKSEILSYLLFGDTFEVLEVNKNWTRIRTYADRYEGWIDTKQYAPIADIHTPVRLLDTMPVQIVVNERTGEKLYLLTGSVIPVPEERQFKLARDSYSFLDEPVLSNNTFSPEEVLRLSTFFMQAPYLWGGRSLFGIDCSGFTQLVFKLMGISLQRDAWQQAEQGELVGFLQEAKAGDLAFFDNDEGRIIHVGIMLSNHEIVHASGRVKIDSIDNEGIYSSDLKRYTHKLRIVKRFNP